MAPFVFLTLILHIFLIFLVSSAPIVIATGFVIDVNGNPVLNSAGSYYMNQHNSGAGFGPIGWTNGINYSCPLSVTTIPVIAYTHDNTISLYSSLPSEFLPEGSNIAIKFNAENTPCNKSLWWFTGVNLDSPIEHDFLELEAGTDDESYSWVIKKSDKGKHLYELQYCVKDGSCSPVYRDPKSENLVVWLNANLETKPFQFYFSKANSFEYMAM